MRIRMPPTTSIRFLIARARRLMLNAISQHRCSQLLINMTMKNNTLSVVPLRAFYLFDKIYYQRNAFAGYLKDISQFFDNLEIIAPVKKCDKKIGGLFISSLPQKNISFLHLPYENNINKYSSLISIYVKCIYTLYKGIRRSNTVYIFLPGNIGTIACLWSLIFRKPFVLYIAGDSVEVSMIKLNQKVNFINICKLFASYFNMLVTRLAARKARFCLVAGDILYNKLKNNNIYQRIPILEMNYDNLYLRNDTCKNKTVRCLFVGNLNRLKGITYLLYAIKRLKDDGLSISLDIIGIGPLDKDLKRLSKELEIDDVVYFRGYIYDKSTLFEFYRISDIFILPTLSEGFPRVIYEAMGHSLPIITTPVGGIPILMKHKENSLLVPIKSDFAIAEGIQELRNNSLLRQNIIKNGRKIIIDLLKQNSSDQFISLYFGSNCGK